jgi:alcohol dehydrogenase class IV
MATFTYTSFAQQVIFGEGSLHQLGQAAARFGWRQMLLCVTSGARARGGVARIEAALGDRLALTFDGVAPHVPEEMVAHATALAERADVEAVIGFGGGSAIGAAKAIASALEAHRMGHPTPAAYPTDQPLIPVVAIPTTYSGSEMTAVYGVTRAVDGAPRKVTVSDPKIAPKLVLYDPLLTLDLPLRVTAGTGINAVAHCIEALYSTTRNPVSTAVALAGLRAMAHALPRLGADGADPAARAEMLEGAYLAGTALAGVTMALHHGVCQVIGGATGVAHGDVNGIMLAPVMRFNLEVAAPQLAQAAEAMGIADRAGAARDQRAAGMAAAQTVADLVERLRLPRRLREVGVRRTGHRRGRIDQGAAVALLESYLHRLQAGGGSGDLA